RSEMTTFVLVHGSGDSGWSWHRVQRALRDRGHESVAPDLPTDRHDVTWGDCGLAGNADPMIAFYHDVPSELATEAIARERPTAERLGDSPWPAAAVRSIPVRSIVTTRDRLIPPAVQRRVAAERLAITEPNE